MKGLIMTAILFLAITFLSCVKSPLPFIDIVAPAENEIIKAGNSFEIKWRSYHNTKTVQISLYYGRQLITEAFVPKEGGQEKLIRNNLENVLGVEAPNTGRYTWTIPSDFILSGSNFHLKISVPEYPKMTAKSAHFQIQIIQR